jgi:hypothetical protein
MIDDISVVIIVKNGEKTIKSTYHSFNTRLILRFRIFRVLFC